MTTIFKCDGCGEHVGLAWLQLDIDHWASGLGASQRRRLDYCQDCALEVVRELVKSRPKRSAEESGGGSE